MKMMTLMTRLMNSFGTTPTVHYGYSVAFVHSLLSCMMVSYRMV